MEETIKYFQPDITDLRVGYECEVKWHTYGDGINWRSYIVKAGDSILTTDNVRVPYLTKEQIEAEGWRSIHWREYLWEKGNKIIHFFNGQKEDVDDSTYLSTFTIHNSSKVLFEGECRCINDFRQIMKFLCIK